jgi:hypothetical protein
VRRLFAHPTLSPEDVAAMSTSLGGCLNVHSGKPSYIAVVSTDGTFSRDTKVDSVVDDHGITWKANPKWRGNPKVLPIQLLGKGYDKEDAPDGGTVTVTTSSPATQTNGSVNYVDDTPP